MNKGMTIILTGLMIFQLSLKLLAEETVPPADNEAYTEKANYETLSFDQQSNKGSDLALVRKIRNELTNDKFLSKNGKNIKIIVVEKEITLKGAVNSDGEKQRIKNLITKLSDTYKIRDQLEIARGAY